MAALVLSDSFFNAVSEVLNIKRLDPKHPDQTRPQYTDVVTGIRGVVEVDYRQGSLESEKGLDEQEFIYRIVLKNTDASALQNKDVVVFASGTELNIIQIDPIVNTIYTLCICNNIQDPNLQRRR